MELVENNLYHYLLITSSNLKDNSSGILSKPLASFTNLFCSLYNLSKASSKVLIDSRFISGDSIPKFKTLYNWFAASDRDWETN